MATYIKIATVTVGAGGAASMDFTSISNAYTDLCLKISGRADVNNQNHYITFNSNSTGYSFKIVYGSGVAASSSPGTDNWAVGVNPSGYTASTFSNQEIYIPNYAGSVNKSFSSDMVLENNASGTYMGLSAHLWSNTAAITSISLSITGGGKYVQYSSATLYGIKKS